MLHSAKKILKYSAKIASLTKHKVEEEVKKLVKANKITTKEGKIIAYKLLKELKNQKDRVEKFIIAELKKEIKKSKPYIKKGKKIAKKTGSAVKKKAKSVAKKVLKKAESKTKKAARKVAKTVKAKRR